MKFAFAILLALFAVLCICQAFPQPEEATAQSNGDEAKVESKSDEQILAEIKANPNGRFWWGLISKGVQLIGNWISNQ